MKYLIQTKLMTHNRKDWIFFAYINGKNFCCPIAKFRTMKKGYKYNAIHGDVSRCLCFYSVYIND